MVGICGACNGAIKGIVWYKFAGEPWRSYQPTTFPFSYEYVDNGNGSWTLTFFRRILYCVWTVQIKANIISKNFPNGQILGVSYTQSGESNRIYGGENSPEASIVGSNGFYYLNCFDQFGNPWQRIIFYNGISNPLRSTGDPWNPPTNNNVLANSVWIDSSTKLFCSTIPSTPCPSPWDKPIFSTSGSGQPQIQITCGSDKCPPDTACECDCGIDVCCYDATGVPIYYYLK